MTPTERVIEAARAIYEADDVYTVDPTEKQRQERHARDKELGEALSAYSAPRPAEPRAEDVEGMAIELAGVAMGIEHATPVGSERVTAWYRRSVGNAFDAYPATFDDLARHVLDLVTKARAEQVEACAEAVTSEGWYRDEGGEKAAAIIRALAAPTPTPEKK